MAILQDTTISGSLDYIAQSSGDGITLDLNTPVTGKHLEITGSINATGNINLYEVVASSNIYSYGDVVASYSSDKRLKDNLTFITNPINKIKSIGGYEFDWNNKQDTYTGHDIGVVAQEIEEILPELVNTRKNGYKAVKYEKLVALLIEGVKEQQKQIDELKSKLNGITK